MELNTNNWITILLMLISAFLAFIGFVGKDLVKKIEKLENKLEVKLDDVVTFDQCKEYRELERRNNEQND